MKDLGTVQGLGISIIGINLGLLVLWDVHGIGPSIVVSITGILIGIGLVVVESWRRLQRVETINGKMGDKKKALIAMGILFLLLIGGGQAFALTMN